MLYIPYSVGFTFVLHGKVHANYMIGVTSRLHKSSLSSEVILVPQRKVGTYINYCMYTNTVRDDILHNIIGQYCKQSVRTILVYNEKLTHHIWSPHMIMVQCVCCKSKHDQEYRVGVQQLVYNNEKNVYKVQM